MTRDEFKGVLFEELGRTLAPGMESIERQP